MSEVSEVSVVSPRIELSANASAHPCSSRQLANAMKSDIVYWQMKKREVVVISIGKGDFMRAVKEMEEVIGQIPYHDKEE